MVESRVSRLNKRKASKASKPSVIYNLVGICVLALVIFVGGQLFF